LFVTGGLDDPSTQANETRKQYAKFGLATGVHVLPNAPHGFLGKQVFTELAVDEIDAFFSIHLKGKR